MEVTRVLRCDVTCQRGESAVLSVSTEQTCVEAQCEKEMRRTMAEAVSWRAMSGRQEAVSGASRYLAVASDWTAPAQGLVSTTLTTVK